MYRKRKGAGRRRGSHSQTSFDSLHVEVNSDDAGDFGHNLSSSALKRAQFRFRQIFNRTFVWYWAILVAVFFIVYVFHSYSPTDHSANTLVSSQVSNANEESGIRNAESNLNNEILRQQNIGNVPFKIDGSDGMPKLPQDSSKNSNSTHEFGEKGALMRAPVILCLTYNRPHFLRRTVESLLNTAGVSDYHLVLTQDGSHSETSRLIDDVLRPMAAAKGVSLTHLRHSQLSVSSSTMKLAKHYKDALSVVCPNTGSGKQQPMEGITAAISQKLIGNSPHGYNDIGISESSGQLFADTSHVIVIEDDMVFGADFLEYFSMAGDLLSIDDSQSLYCATSWNDNGLSHVASHSTAALRTVERSDYFAGLGWMLRCEFFVRQLGDQWPTDHWDHFMRTSQVTRGRDCLYPLVSRNKNIGDVGATVDGGFFQKYLAKQHFVADAKVDFYGDLELKKRIGDVKSYERQRKELFKKAATVSRQNFDRCADIPRDFWGGLKKEALESVRRMLSGANAKAREQMMEESDSGTALVYLVTYGGQNVWRCLAESFGLLDTARTQHRHSTVLRVTLQPSNEISMDFTVIFANSKLCSEYLTEDLGLGHLYKPPMGALKAVAGSRGLSCDSVCSKEGLRCEASQFDYLNDCQSLNAHFPCLGCLGGVLGADVPNYVADFRSKPEMAGLCLTTEHRSTCAGKHHTTSRLCPCV